MNDHTQEIIAKLAEKLGTTAEHLWGVLVTQAPITAATDTIGLLVCGVALLLGFFFALRTMRRANESSSLMGLEGAIITWIVWGFFCFVFLVTFFCTIGGIVAGFTNPEYVALKELLRSL